MASDLKPNLLFLMKQEPSKEAWVVRGHACQLIFLAFWVLGVPSCFCNWSLDHEYLSLPVGLS